MHAKGERPRAKPDEPWTVGRLLTWTTSYLTDKGSESPRLDAEVLLAHALGITRTHLYVRFHEEPPEDARQRFRDMVRQRVEGCPVAYLVGRKEFYSLAFEVGREVLIPRPDTECLVGEALRLAKGMEAPRVLDVGTGSGNIAVSFAHQHPTAQVTAIDLSQAALTVAARNAATHGVTERVRFLEGDLFAPLDCGERFELVLSNPPYIAREDLPGLPRGVRDYEPQLALDGGPGGYAVLERFLAGVAEHLQPGGYLIVEIGAPQEAVARERIGVLPRFELGETLRDYSGHPRVLVARWRGE